MLRTTSPAEILAAVSAPASDDIEPGALDPARTQRDRSLREMLREPIARAQALGPGSDLALAGSADLEEAGPAVALICADRTTDPSGLPSLSAAARSVTSRLAALLTDKAGRAPLTEAAIAAGFDRVELAHPPADAERSFVLFENSLLLAWAEPRR